MRTTFERQFVFLILCACGFVLAGCSSERRPGLLSSMGYHVGKTKVWLKSPKSGMDIYAVDEVVGADPKSFTSRTLTNKEGATDTVGFDATSVFVGAKKVAGADLKTFSYVGISYFKDKKHAYYQSTRISDDSAHFELVGEFARDSKNVYFGGGVFSEDAPHFARLGQSRYYKDQATCWYSISPMKDADPATLQSLGGDYAADGARVFHQMNEIEGAIPGSFRPLEHDYSRDEKSVFYQSEKIGGADAATFRVLDELHAVDQEHCFYYGQILEGADPKTFAPIDNFYAKDAKHVWLNGAVIEGADPSTFRVIDGPAGKSRDSKYEYDMGKRVGQ